MNTLLDITRNPLRTSRLIATGRSTGRPPGPKGLPFVGVLPEYQKDPFNYLRSAGVQYGDVFRVPLPVLDVVCINHPDHVGHIMNDTTGGYSMIGPREALICSILGASVPYMEGDRFRRRRRLLTPVFRPHALQDVSLAIVDEFDKRMSRWDAAASSGAQIDLQHEIAGLTLPAFVRAMFGVVLTDEEITWLDTQISHSLKMISASILINRPPNLIPSRNQPDLVRSLLGTRAWIDDLIEQRLANPIEGTDLLQMLLDARDEDGQALSRKDLIAELWILIAGGYETVVASASWTLALLPTNPEAHSKLVDEVDALGGRRPEYADLAQLSWTKACFDEGQRLQGHPFHPRIALRDDMIGGYFIPKGTLVGVSMYALHRDPRWWDNPDFFDPNRFADKEIASARPNLAFIPFGAGPHRCIGAQMGYMNAQFLLALIHQRYTVTVKGNWTPKHASTFSCTIQGGLPVSLAHRESVTSTAYRADAIG